MYISKLDVNVTLSFPQKVTFCLSIAVRAWATFAVTTTTIIAEIKAVWVSFVKYKVCFCTDEKRKNIIYIIKLDTIYLVHTSHACIIDVVDVHI